MKTNSLILTFASLTLAVVGANAASTPTESEITHLPAYRVEAPRYTAAERAVQASLAELRATAKVPVATVAIPAMSEKLASDKATIAAEVAKHPVPATRLAKN